MKGAIDIVVNLSTPKEKKAGQLPSDDSFRTQVRQSDEVRKGVTIPDYIKRMDRAGIERSLLIAVRAAVVVDKFHRRFDQPLSMFAWVGDRGGRQNKRRLTAIERTNTPQPPQHIRHVAAENSSICVHLVDHHIAQVAKKS